MRYFQADDKHNIDPHIPGHGSQTPRAQRVTCLGEGEESGEELKQISKRADGKQHRSEVWKAGAGGNKHQHETRTKC